MIFWIKVLTGWAFLNHFMTIFKDRRPKIPSMKDFLGYSHPRKMTATCSRVAIIQNMFNFFMCKASSKDGIDTTSVQCIIQNEIVLCMVTDTMKIVMTYVRLKYLSLEINNQISIPCISCAYEEQKFIRE